MIAGAPPVDRPHLGYQAVIGTAVHEAIADAVARVEVDAWTREERTAETWLVEHRVHVGHVNGVDVAGNVDLFHVPSGTVVDHKVTSTRQAPVKAANPDRQYVAQLHLYGKGLEDAGYRVTQVALNFVPRDGGDVHVWSAPYDRQVAVDALDRASAIAFTIERLGLDQAVTALPMVDAYCPWCPWHRDDATTPDACPGVPRPTRTASTALADILN